MGEWRDEQMDEWVDRRMDGQMGHRWPGLLARWPYEGASRGWTGGRRWLVVGGQWVGDGWIYRWEADG